MQVCYRLEPNLQQASGRLAYSLIPALAGRVELKAESIGRLETGWNELYGYFSRAQPQPRVQLYQGALKDFKAQPLQWNILFEPELPSAESLKNQLKTADEIWVFSQEKAQTLKSLGLDLQITLLPPAAGSLEFQAAELPMELNEPQVLFASLAWQNQASLRQLLEAYLSGFAANPEVTLALHLQADENAQDEIETQLMKLLEAVAAQTQTELETLNLETWIGSLEADVYLSLLERSQLLLSPDSLTAACEALKLGKNVVGIECQALGLQAELTAASLQEALNTPPLQADFGPETLAQAMQQRLAQIEQEVDFEARAAAWKHSQAQQQQGRKQKYSLFHSDYKEPEMQARRSWHLRYAQKFDKAPGDILDIGCGSAIFLELMRELKLPACGLDPDPDMVKVCLDLGLQAELGDERQLSQWQDESLGGIHASHIIEHIDGERAIAMIEHAFRVLRPGGKLIIRTPNWRNEQVRHEGFWLDITHIRPYPLPLLKQVLEDAGFEIEQMGFEEFGWNDTFIVGRKGGSHG